MKKILFTLTLLTALGTNLFAAVGCDLNEPDRDVKRFFPQSTGYKTEYFSIVKSGGDPLLAQIESKLGDNFSGLYETMDVPYTFYTVFKGQEKLGYIHGANQKGAYGGIQVFLIFDTQGNIKNLYLQKLTSKKGKAFRSAEFAKQFEGLNLQSFECYDVKAAKPSPSCPAGAIENTPQDEKDFPAVMRGVKKNLVLTNAFIFSKKEDK